MCLTLQRIHGGVLKDDSCHATSAGSTMTAPSACFSSFSSLCRPTAWGLHTAASPFPVCQRSDAAVCCCSCALGGLMRTLLRIPRFSWRSSLARAGVGPPPYTARPWLLLRQHWPPGTLAPRPPEHAIRPLRSHREPRMSSWPGIRHPKSSRRPLLPLALFLP